MVEMQRVVVLSLLVILNPDKITCSENVGLTEMRKTFNKDCGKLVSKQVNTELHACYLYLAMASYFGRPDVALSGFSKYFFKASADEMEHAIKLIKYQHKRGGVVTLHDIQKPTKLEWESCVDAVQDALNLEIDVQRKLIELHEVAVKTSDAHLCDFLEGEFLTEQVESIKILTDFVTTLNRVGPGLGEYLFDRETLGCENKV